MDNLPKAQLWSSISPSLQVYPYLIFVCLPVFNGTPDNKTLAEDAASITTSAGTISPGYSYHFSQIEATTYQGGSVKVADSTTNFPVSKTIAAALVTIQPGAMREMHWHPTSDEWAFYLSGQGRVTVASGPGDVSRGSGASRF